MSPIRLSFSGMIFRFFTSSFTLSTNSGGFTDVPISTVSSAQGGAEAQT